MGDNPITISCYALISSMGWHKMFETHHEKPFSGEYSPAANEYSIYLLAIKAPPCHIKERLLRHPEGFLAVTGLNLVIAREWNDRSDPSFAPVISNTPRVLPLGANVRDLSGQ